MWGHLQIGALPDACHQELPALHEESWLPVSIQHSPLVSPTAQIPWEALGRVWPLVGACRGPSLPFRLAPPFSPRQPHYISSLHTCLLHPSVSVLSFCVPVFLPGCPWHVPPPHAFLHGLLRHHSLSVTPSSCLWLLLPPLLGSRLFPSPLHFATGTPLTYGSFFLSFFFSSFWKSLAVFILTSRQPPVGLPVSEWQNSSPTLWPGQPLLPTHCLYSQF